MKIQFTLPIIPKSKLTVQHTKTGIAYHSKEEKQREAELMPLLAQHRPEKPLEGAIMLSVMVYLPIPSSKPRWWKEAAAESFIRPTGKPDLSNYIKLIEDCMESLGFFKNDSQIVEYVVGWQENGDAEYTGKYYSENPRWNISLKEIPQPQTKKEWGSMK
ncbi:MAG TPA: RusA family crossover junction endodeoxyribonuclease [bacterium]|nr:RusA family crossover junction endodeoxyribonuclease [bacterium]